MYTANGVLLSNSLVNEVKALNKYSKLLYVTSIISVVIGGLAVFYNGDKTLTGIILAMAMVLATLATVIKQLSKTINVSDEGVFKLSVECDNNLITLKLCNTLSTSWRTCRLSVPQGCYTYNKESHDFNMQAKSLDFVSLAGDILNYDLELTIQDAENIYKNFKSRGYYIKEV